MLPSSNLLKHQSQQNYQNFARVNPAIKNLFNDNDIKKLSDLISSNDLRLNKQDALWLYKHDDLFLLAHLANLVCKKKHSDRIYFNINRHINPTNICVFDCKFCAFAKRANDPDAYAFSMEEIISRVKKACNEGAQEIHMVGGLHPRWGLKHFLDIISNIKKTAPNIHLKGFTAVEIQWLAKKAKFSIDKTLHCLKQAGLDSMPGGGAEIFDEQIRQKITAKLDHKSWLDIHKTAHNIGMKSNATMLYGHIENIDHRIDHLNHLRDLQDITKGFNAFIPLSFQPYNNDMNISDYTMGADDLRTIAISRLFLDNFLHIKAYWIMLGKEIAQLALSFGANDLDGTVTEEKISKSAGGQSGESLDKSSLQRLITSTGKKPYLRDSIYKKFNICNLKSQKNTQNYDHSYFLSKSSNSSGASEIYKLICDEANIKISDNIFSNDNFFKLINSSQKNLHSLYGNSRFLKFFDTSEHFIYQKKQAKIKDNFHSNIKSNKKLVLHRFKYPDGIANPDLVCKSDNLNNMIICDAINNLESKYDHKNKYFQHMISFNDLWDYSFKSLNNLQNILYKTYNLNNLDLFLYFDYQNFKSGKNFDYIDFYRLLNAASSKINHDFKIIYNPCIALKHQSNINNKIDWQQFLTDIFSIKNIISNKPQNIEIKFIELFLNNEQLNNSISVHEFLQACTILKLSFKDIGLCSFYTNFANNQSNYYHQTKSIKNNSGYNSNINSLSRKKIVAIMLKSSVSHLGFLDSKHLSVKLTVDKIIAKENLKLDINSNI